MKFINFAIVLVSSIIFGGCSTSRTMRPEQVFARPNERNVVFLSNQTDKIQTFVVNGEKHSVDPGSRIMVHADFPAQGLPEVSVPTKRHGEILMKTTFNPNVDFIMYIVEPTPANSNVERGFFYGDNISKVLSIVEI